MFRLKFLAYFSLIVVFVIATVGIVIVYKSFDRQSLQTLQIEAAKKTKIVSALILNPMQVGDYNEVVNVMSRLLQDENITSIQVSNQFGDTIVKREKLKTRPSFYSKEFIESEVDNKIFGSIAIGYQFSYFEKFAREFKVKMIGIMVGIIALLTLLTSLFLSFFQRFFSKLATGFNEISTGQVVEMATESFVLEAREISGRFNDTSKKLQELARLEIDRARVETIEEITAQVAHDIRSPLSALSVVEGGLEELSNEKRELLRGAIARIQSIANDLLKKRKTVIENPRGKRLEQSLLKNVILDVVGEKRIQYQYKTELDFSFNVDVNAQDIELDIEESKLKRVLSNLINNCVEAIPSSGSIQLIGRVVGRTAEICIKDDGGGIPAEIRKQLGAKGVTHGKEEGSGLGIYYSKKVITDAGGSMDIFSRVGEGTLVIIRLPIVMAN